MPECLKWKLLYLCRFCDKLSKCHNSGYFDTLFQRFKSNIRYPKASDFVTHSIEEFCQLHFTEFLSASHLIVFLNVT